MGLWDGLEHSTTGMVDKTNMNTVLLNIISINHIVLGVVFSNFAILLAPCCTVHPSRCLGHGLNHGLNQNGGQLQTQTITKLVY